jgi:hypothetical protein
MAKVKYSSPVESMTGKLSARKSSGRVYVNRRKCYGTDAKGRPIYGPNETYVYNLHEGPWTEAVENNRQLFRRAQVLAREELKDPERLAYWQPLFDKQFKHPHSGQKHYATILGFVVAQIHARLKEENQNQDTTPSDSAV